MSITVSVTSEDMAFQRELTAYLPPDVRASVSRRESEHVTLYCITLARGTARTNIERDRPFGPADVPDVAATAERWRERMERRRGPRYVDDPQEADDIPL